MPDSYLIDGYNLIHALGFLPGPRQPKALEQARARFFEFLKASLHQDEAAHTTIVFDAQKGPRHMAREQRRHGMHVRFAPRQQSADDLIETLIDEHPRPDRLIVISNDVRLQQAAQRRGACAWTHGQFLDFLDTRRAGPARGETAADDRPAEAMSDEEKEHWRREFAELEQDPELKEFFDLDRFEDE